MKYTAFKSILLSLILLLSLTASCSKDSNTITVHNPQTELELNDISYGTEMEQVYDIFLPANRSKTNTKVCILVHGGSWVGGDKSDTSEIAEQLKADLPQYAIVNMNYQLAGIGKSPFPMQVDDIGLLLQELRNSTDLYEISSEFCLIGISAGGQLSLLYSYAYDEQNQVAAVCSIVGPTNFTDSEYISNPLYSSLSQAVSLLTGESLIDNPSFYEQYSPFHVVTEAAPPTLLIYGGMDPLVPVSQGMDLHEKLESLNIPNEYLLFEEEGHGWEGAALNTTLETLQLFIEKHLN